MSARHSHPIARVTNQPAIPFDSTPRDAAGAPCVPGQWYRLAFSGAAVIGQFRAHPEFGKVFIERGSGIPWVALPGTTITTEAQS